MFLSKIWFALVALVAGIAVAAAFVAPRSADRRIGELEGQRLDRGQYAAEQMLKNEAHFWLNYATRLSRDASLTETLEAASSPRGSESRVMNETLKKRLKGLVSNLAKAGIESIVAFDNKGRVVARIGERESDYGDSIGGADVVADALRGYLSDDVWGSNGKLQRIAAVPVLSKTRDRIVGGLYVGVETGKRLLDLWKHNLDVDIAILLRGQVIAATMPTATFGSLGGEIESHRSDIADAQRTKPIPLEIGGQSYLAVAAPFVGQASEQDAYYALVGKMAPASNPLALLSSTKRDDLRWANFPWVGLLGGVLVMIGVGVFLQRWEIDRPLGRLRKDVQLLARGEIAKLMDATYPGKLGGIARDVNAAIERVSDVPAHKSETARKDLSAILGPPPGEPASVFDLPQSHFGAGLAPASPFAPPPSRTPPPVNVGFGANLPAASPFGPPNSARANTPPPVSPFGGPALGGAPASPFGAPAPAASVGRPFGRTPPPVSVPPAPPPANRVGALPSARLTSPPMPPARAPSPPPASSNGVEVPAAPRPAGSVTALLGPAFPGMLPDQPLPPLGTESPTRALSEPAPEKFEGGDRTPVVKLDSSGRSARPATLEIRAFDGAGSDAERDPRAPVITTDPSGGPEAEEAHVREVFEAYLLTRRNCGEATGSITIEKFRDKLAANRQQLVAKYNCRTARFAVYVKDGKAAIKATPVR